MRKLKLQRLTPTDNKSSSVLLRGGCQSPEVLSEQSQTEKTRGDGTVAMMSPAFLFEKELILCAFQNIDPNQMGV